MKQFIQVINAKGEVNFMHNNDQNSSSCDAFISGLIPKEFNVLVFDQDGKSKEFTFARGDVSQIISRVIASDTKTFIEVWSKGMKDLGELLNDKEIYVGYDRGTLDKGLAMAVEDGLYGKDTGQYFFRLKEQPDGKWTISFVFCNNEEVQSTAFEWPEFKYVK